MMEAVEILHWLENTDQKLPSPTRLERLLKRVSNATTPKNGYLIEAMEKLESICNTKQGRHLYYLDLDWMPEIYWFKARNEEEIRLRILNSFRK
jgi:hypothetical protein